MWHGNGSGAIVAARSRWQCDHASEAVIVQDDGHEYDNDVSVTTIGPGSLV